MKPKRILLITMLIISIMLIIVVRKEPIKKWFHKEIISAVILNLKCKYFITPQGLES